MSILSFGGQTDRNHYRPHHLRQIWMTMCMTSCSCSPSPFKGCHISLSLPFLYGRTFEAFLPISYILPTSCPLQSFSILCGMIEMGIKPSWPPNLQARDGYKSLLLQAMASLLSPKADHPSAWLPLPLEARLAIRENNSWTLMSFDQVVSFNLSGASSTRAEFLHRQHA